MDHYPYFGYGMRSMFYYIITRFYMNMSQKGITAPKLGQLQVFPPYWF